MVFGLGDPASPKGEKRRGGETDSDGKRFGSRILQLIFFCCSILDKSCMNPESTFHFVVMELWVVCLKILY